MRFVIISSRRSGSSHFVNIIGGHPEIMCHGNMFGGDKMPVFWPKNPSVSLDEKTATRVELRALKKSDPQAYLDRVLATGHGRPHVGFKIFPRDNNRILDQLIGTPSVRKVVLMRTNVLARYSSQLVSRESGAWGAREGDPKGQTPRVRFSAEEFKRFHTADTAFYSGVIHKLLEAREPYHLIRYEDVNDPLLLMSAVAFIGADTGKPILASEQRRIQVKQNAADIVSRFSNPEDVQTFLKEHGLLGWAYEGETLLSSRFGEDCGEKSEFETGEPGNAMVASPGEGGYDEEGDGEGGDEGED